MNRQIYLDSFAVVWMLAALALALSPRKHPGTTPPRAPRRRSRC
ncbi:hypothetical protein [Actinoplanes nipponensis]